MPIVEHKKSYNPGDRVYDKVVYKYCTVIKIHSKDKKKALVKYDGETSVYTRKIKNLIMINKEEKKE